MLVRGRGVKEQIVVAPVLTSAMIPPMVQEWLANGQGTADWTDLAPNYFWFKSFKKNSRSWNDNNVDFCFENTPQILREENIII